GHDPRQSRVLGGSAMVMTGADLFELRETLLTDASRLEAILKESGQHIRTHSRHDDPRYLMRLAEVSELVANVLDGRVDPYWLKESMATSDFPLLMGDILDRQLLARYREWPITWPAV